MAAPGNTVLICLLGLAVAGAAPADASGWGRVDAPGAGDTVHAGDVTAVRWGSLPDGIDEFELLLSVDGGTSFPIRLTPQLDPGVGEYRWRVPNLSAPRARLRLRVGIDGHEIEGPPGPVFAIAASSRVPAAGLELMAGEWWVAAEPPPEPSPAEPSPRVADRRHEGPPAPVACGPSKEPLPAPAVAAASPATVAVVRDRVPGRIADVRPAPETCLRP